MFVNLEDINSDYVSEELLAKMSDQEIRAVASDRGYDIDRDLKGRFLRFNFLVAQSQGLSRKINV